MQYEVRPFQPGDEDAVLALHNRAFAGHAPRTRAHWEWKFRHNPLGATEMVVGMEPASSAAALVCRAVYAVVPQRCVLQGEPGVAGLQTDLAVDPSLRNGLGGSRLILATGRLYSELFLQGTKTLEWGFPEPHLQRVCLAHLKVGVLRDVVFLVREAQALHRSASKLAVEPVARFGAEVDELWLRCRGGFGAAGVRDARYLNWRYREHPEVPYLTLAAREPGGALRGLAVARAGGADERLLSLMDWLVPRDDHEAEGALLETLLEAARARGKSHLAAWFPLFQPEAQRWQQEFGFHARATPFQESYRCWAKGLGRRWLDEHWYQTMGDIDFL